MAHITQGNVVVMQGTVLPDAATMPNCLVFFHLEGTDGGYLLETVAGVKAWRDLGGGGISSITVSPPLTGTGTVLDPVEIALEGITTAYLGDLAVTTDKIDDLAVTTGKINDLAVTTQKLADSAITTSKYVDDSITRVKLAFDIDQILGLVDVEYYVNAATGSDSDNGSIGSPFATLEYALSLIPACPTGKCRVYLIGAGPYTFPEKWDGPEPQGFFGEPLMIVGEFDVPVKTGSLTAAVAPTATVSGGGMVVDAYRGLTYHGLTGTSAGKRFTIATNSATQLTSLANTFGAANGDTFEILQPLTVITGADLQINGPGKVGFCACRFTNTTWEVTSNATALFDACVFASTSRFRANFEARVWFCATAFAQDFYFITDIGTQSGTVGAYFAPSNALITFETKSLTRGWLVASRIMQMDNQAYASLGGLDVDVSAQSNVIALTADYGSIFRKNTGWGRIVGASVSGTGIAARHGTYLDLSACVITGCITAAIGLQTSSFAVLNGVSGSSGNGVGVLVDDGSTLFNTGGNTLTGTSGNVVVDGSSLATPWASIPALISSSSQVPVRVTTTKTFAAHTAIVAADQYVPVNSSGGAFTQNLPAANAVYPGWRCQIQDQTGQCTVNQVTISRVGADTFQGGGTTFLVDIDYGGVVLQSDGVSIWYVVGRILL